VPSGTLARHAIAAG
jgi:heme/copper-type cytochrome/quinol oxidase subunit 3